MHDKHCKFHKDESVTINDKSNPYKDEITDGKGVMIYRDKGNHVVILFDIRYCPYCGQKVCKDEL